MTLKAHLSLTQDGQFPPCVPHIKTVFLVNYVQMHLFISVAFDLMLLPAVKWRAQLNLLLVWTAIEMDVFPLLEELKEYRLN